VPVVTGDARVDRLLSNLTLDEKLKLIHGTQEDPAVYQGQAGYLAGIPRLGIPGLRFADGPPGVLTRVPSQAETATMGVAATFSIRDAEANGTVIGREDRALGIDVSLQPFVNIARDLEFGRAYNTFGEDPFLTSEMAVAHVKGIQAQHVMAQIKHFVGYDSDASDIFIDDQPLHEVYLAPFEAAIRRADVSSIMCSYNRINGTFACGNANTLTRFLRDEVGFKGFVTSDWGATHAVNFINAGLDMEMPGEPGAGDLAFLPSFFDAKPTPPAPKMAPSDDNMEGFYNHLPEEPKPAPGVAGDWGLKLDPKKMPEALKDGTVSEAAITRAAGRVLYEIVHFGYLDGLSKHAITKQSILPNADIIRKTGEDAAVLLKNDGNVLPLKATELSDVVLIGPTARQVDAIGISGERSVGLPQRQVGPLAAMGKLSGNPNIRFAVADDLTGSTIPAAALTHDGKPGLLRTGKAGDRVDATLDFTRKKGNALQPNTTATWKGTLTVERDGEYWLNLQALGANAALKVDGKRIGSTGAFQGGIHGDIVQANQDDAVPTTDGLDNVRRALDLKAGAHAIEVDITPDGSKAPAQVRLNWYTPEQRQADHDAAIAAAKQAKTAVVFVWSRLQPVFGLPGDQDKLVEEIAAVNPNTVVVLNVSMPVALPWIDKVKGVLQMWWPGDEGGWATANVLLGNVSPAGRLPISWAKNLADYAATDPKYPERSRKGVDGKTTFTEGVDVGYRWFDKLDVQPLFAFGHGLSYTTFDYSGLSVKKASDGGLDVAVTIRNTGAMGSDEVPQLYLGAPAEVPAGVQFPVRALVAFDRVHIGKGESREVVLHVAPRQLQYWSTKDGKWITASGKRTISVGGSSRDLRLKEDFE
jgi:beta-glucosidase